MSQYGSEFEDLFVNQRLELIADDDDVTEQLLRLVGRPGVTTIYLPPRSQRLEAQPDGATRDQPDGYVLDPLSDLRSPFLSRHVFPDGVLRRVIVIPEHITLWFAPGAFFLLGNFVVLVIRGGIRAESQQIFGLPDVRALRRDIHQFPPDVPVTSMVRLETTQIEEVRPEWFGVVRLPSNQGVSAVDAPANSRALQACIHAACRDRTREGVSLPPLTVRCQGVYCIHETMVALPTINGTGALWLRGHGDASTRNSGIAVINRFPIGHPSYAYALPDTGERFRLRRAEEREDSALLWVHPRVSLKVEGVGLKCLPWGDAGARDRGYDVRACIRVAGRVGDQAPLASRHVVLERCGITGGTETIIAVDDRDDPRVEVPVITGPSLGLPPGVLGPAGITQPWDLPPPQISGAVDSRWEVARAVVPLAHSRRRGARIAIEGCALDGVISQRPDGSDPNVTTRSSKRMIDARLSKASMVSIAGGKVHQSTGALYGAQQRASDGTFGVIDLEAGLFLRGGCALVRAVSFHLSEGPRPSRPAGESHLPDGQDIWLDTENGTRQSTHLTVLHADSQSWWFLGGDAPGPADATNVVSLLNVGAQDVNLPEAVRPEPDPMRPEEAENPPPRDNAAYREPWGRFRADYRDNGSSFRLYQPPSIAWPGGAVPLLLEGCVFDRYCTAPDDGGGHTANVGSAFRLPISGAVPNWYDPSVIPRRGSRNESLSDRDSVALMGRPIPLGISTLRYYPYELTGRSILDRW